MNTNWKNGLRKIISLLLILLLAISTFALPLPSYAEADSLSESQQLAKAALFGTETEKGVINYYQESNNRKLVDWWDLIAVNGSGEDIRQYGLPKATSLPTEPNISNCYKAIMTKLLRGEDASNEARVLAELQQENGTFSTSTNDQSWAIIALDAYNRGNQDPIPYDIDNAISVLKSQQYPSGGFAYDTASWAMEDSNTSAFVAIAIAQYETEDALAIKTGLRKYIKNMVAPNGGFKWLDSSTENDINSNAAVIMGLIALGIDPNGGDFDVNDKTPLDALLSYQLPNGSFYYGNPSEPNTLATQQAAIALIDIFNNSSSFLTLEKNNKTFDCSSYVQLESDTSILTKGNITFEVGSSTLADAAKIAWKMAGMIDPFETANYKAIVNGTLQASGESGWDTSLNEGDKILIIPESITHISSFTTSNESIEIGQPLTLTLIGKSTLDNTDVPISGASITINGEAYGGNYPHYTNKDGNITISTFNEAGEYIISSLSTTVDDGKIISRPLCIVNVSSKTPYERTVKIQIEGVKTDKGVQPYFYDPAFTAVSDGSKIITVEEVVNQISEANGWDEPNFDGGFLNSINSFPREGDPKDYWMWILNGVSSWESMVGYAVANNDDIVIYYGGNAAYPKMDVHKLGDLSGSDKYAEIILTSDGFLGTSAIPNALVTWNGKTYVTNESGIVTIPAIDISAGKKHIQIESYSSNGVANVVRLAPDFKLGLSPEVTVNSGILTPITSSDTPTTYITNSSNPGSLVVDNVIPSENTSTATLPELAIYSEEVGQQSIEVNIAAGTKITSLSNSWDGKIQLPELKDSDSISIPKTVIDKIVSIGSSTESYTFDKPVRLVLAGTAGQRVGYVSGGAIIEIADTLLFDDYDTAAAKLADGFGAAKFVSGKDTVIWTKHFTDFVAYRIQSDPTPGDGSTPAVGDKVSMSIDGIKGSNYMRKTYYDYPAESGKTALSLLVNNVPSARTKSSGYGVYVYSIYDLSEFDKGELSGWLYKVNGDFIGYAADSYKLKANDYVQWVYTKDLGKDVGGNVAGATPLEAGGSILTIEAKVDSTGKAVATITKEDFSKLIENKSGSLNITSNLASLTFDNAALKTISKAGSGDVKITVSKADPSKLSEELQTEIGNRPVYDFSVTVGSKTVSEFNGKVQVSIPYTPAADEDVNALIIYYINESGKLEAINNCKYDETTKQLIFGTDHFSKYAIGYNKVEFSDTKGHWSEANISYLSSRGIIKGKAAGQFMPNDHITRAEFVTILGNKLGADFSKNSTSSFNDVREKDWFAGAVSWAVENKIVTGYEGKFRPNDKISRQEMAVILDRYMTNVDKTGAKADNAEAIKFTDENKIADYAKESVAKMQKLGIINGKTASTFAPADNATRAEAAKMITVLMKKSI